VEKKENEAEGMKKGLLVGQLARVDGQHSDHVSNERENGRSRFLLERMCIPIFTLLTFVFQNRFHFLVIIHLLGRCVRAALAFWAHWSRGRRRQGRESTFDLFLSPIDRLPQYVSPSRLAR
jgi:hypothetical protein